MLLPNQGDRADAGDCCILCAAENSRERHLPRLIATGMSQRAQSNETIRARLPRLQPLTGDFGTPEDVSFAALYLASDEACFTTGAVLTVDGGWTVH